jgi:hypothetical protein
MICDRCGVKLRGKPYVYSAWTKHHYCATSIDACGRRAKKRKR